MTSHLDLLVEVQDVPGVAEGGIEIQDTPEVQPGVPERDFEIVGVPVEVAVETGVAVGDELEAAGQVGNPQGTQDTFEVDTPVDTPWAAG